VSKEQRTGWRGYLQPPLQRTDLLSCRQRGYGCDEASANWSHGHRATLKLNVEIVRKLAM
jgi:hypothetical protein